jgi:hypothetical protein
MSRLMRGIDGPAGHRVPVVIMTCPISDELPEPWIELEG